MSTYPTSDIPHLIGLEPAIRESDVLDPRRDMHQRDVVARGIAMLHLAGIVGAVEFLKSHAVRAQVIERVLWYPEQRRACV